MTEVQMRHYRLTDIPGMIALAERALPTLPNYKNEQVDPARLTYVLNHNLNNAMFFCTVLVVSGVPEQSTQIVGGMAAYCTPTIFSTEVYAWDAFLYIDPEHRSLRNATQLIRSYIEWGRARQASRIMMSHTSGLNVSGLDALLRRNGFREVGALYHYTDE